MRGAIICSAHAGVHSIPFIEREQAGGREREAAAAACTSSQIISQGGMREWSLGRLVGPAASLALRRTDHVMQSVPQPAASALSSSVRPGDSNFIHGIFRRHAKIGGNPAADALHSLPAGRALALGSCLELRSSLARCAPTSSLFLARRARSLLSHPHTHTHTRYSALPFLCTRFADGLPLVQGARLFCHSCRCCKNRNFSRFLLLVWFGARWSGK